MGGNRHKNSARNQTRLAYVNGQQVGVNAKWFTNRVKRNRVRDRIAKAARRKNRGRK